MFSVYVYVLHRVTPFHSPHRVTPFYSNQLNVPSVAAGLEINIINLVLR